MKLRKMNSNVSFVKSIASCIFSISVGMMDIINAISPLFSFALVVVGLITGVRALMVKNLEWKIKKIELKKLNKDHSNE